METYYYNLNEEMFEINKNLIIEEFLSNVNAEDILYVSVKLTNLEKLKSFTEKLSNIQSKVVIELDCEKSYIEEEKEIKKLNEINSLCELKNFSLNLKLENALGSNSFENFTIAKQKIDEFVNNLNTFIEKKKQKGYELSTIEKYFIVYKFVANRVYKEDVNFLNDEMRNWIGVLSSDNVICSGFASLLKCVCDRVFAPEELKCYTQGCTVFDDEGKSYGSHALNIVRIKDEKYNINGLFNSDACWGAKSEENNMQGSYEYCLNPLSIYGMMKNTKFKFRDNLFLYNDIENIGVELLKIENLDHYKENDLISDLFSECELKTFKELKISASIDERLVAKKKEIDDKNQELIKQSKQKVNLFLSENGLNDYKDIILPVMYNKSVLERYPLLKEFQNFCNEGANITENNIELLKQVCQLYKSNPEVFNSVKEALSSHFGSDDAFCQSLEDILKQKFVESKLVFNESEEKRSLNENLYNDYIQEQEKLKDKASCLIKSQRIPLKAIKSGLRMVAEFSGMSEEKIEQYIERELEKIKNFKTTLNLNGNAYNSLNTK